MIRVKIEQGEFEINDGFYTGPSELEELFNIVSQRDVMTWEGPNDYAYAMRMIGEDPYEILEYDEDEPAGINQAPA